MKTSRRHHFVPQFLLSKWGVNGSLHGYRWDQRAGQVRCNKKGPRAFCYETDLYAMESPNVPSDLLEKNFLRYIDGKGATVCATLVAGSTDGLTRETRCEFARLLLSLDARRPPVVGELKSRFENDVTNKINSDEEILEVFRSEGIQDTPFEYYEDATGDQRGDRAVLMLQSIIDNPKIGGQLINAQWDVLHLKDDEGSFLLSDRPMFRSHGYDHANCVWMLPLTPNHAFLAFNSSHARNHVLGNSRRALRKAINHSMINQTERYVFDLPEANKPLLDKRLREVANDLSQHQLPRDAS